MTTSDDIVEENCTKNIAETIQEELPPQDINTDNNTEPSQEEEEIVSSRIEESSSAMSDRIPLLFNHKLYRFNCYINAYEQVPDDYPMAGWRNIFIGVQFHREVLCISQTSGCIYRKMIRSFGSLREDQSFIVEDSMRGWEDTRVMTFIDGSLYLIKSDQVFRFVFEGYVLIKESKGGVGKNWKPNVFCVNKQTIYGIDKQNGNVLGYDFDKGEVFIVSTGRNWSDCAGMIFRNDKIWLFCNSGVYEVDPQWYNTDWSLLGRSQKWSLHQGCIVQIDGDTMLLVSAGSLYRFDLHSYQATFLQGGWRMCNCIIPLRIVDEKDQNFLATGSSTKSA